MTYRGRVQGGVVVLEPGQTLPEGIEVTVWPTLTAEGEPNAARPGIWDKLVQLAREVESEPCDLPEDLARNHDHYLHGAPRKP